MNRPNEETLREALHRIHHVATCRKPDCTERHSYMEIPANPKADADLLLSAAIDELVELRERVKVLEGLKPELPPRPPELDPNAPKVVGLPRYGLRWNGPTQPLAVPMDDGYWTPWHIASAKREGLCVAITKLTDVRDGLHRAQGCDLPIDRIRKLIDRCDEAVNLIDEAMP